LNIFLVILIITTLIITNISILIYLILEGESENQRVMFSYYLIFRIILGLIILLLAIRYYGDDCYNLYIIHYETNAKRLTQTRQCADKRVPITEASYIYDILRKLHVRAPAE